MKQPLKTSPLKTKPLKTLRQVGFTLVEIAVVLVVVGLIIGGILRGTELINSAKARNIIDQKTGIQTALTAFSNRYQATAGDLTQTQASFIGNGVMYSSGGGDGIVALSNPSAATDESVLVFQNLAATGLLSCNSCLAPNSAAITSGNAAANAANSPVNASIGYLQFGTTAPSTSGVFWYDTGTLAAPPARNILTTGAGIPAAILQQVDLKADDGSPVTGLFRQTSIGGANPTASCVNTTTWIITANNCSGAWLF